MDQNLENELNRINNIEVIEPVQERPSTPVRKRLKIFGREVAQLKQYVASNNQLLSQVCEKLDNLTTAQVKPKSILVTKDKGEEGDSKFTTPSETPSLAPSSPRLSRASSRLSQASSRLSPEREQGILPIVQNLLVANKYMLKEQKEKYPEALSGLKRHVKGRETVANRLKKDAELIEERITETLKSEIASLIPLNYGIKPETFQSLTFLAIPEDQADFALADSVMKSMIKTHSKIKDEGAQIRHLIEDLIENYTGRLTATQFRNIVVNMCHGEFRDIIKNTFKGKQLNRAIAMILQLYGNIKSEEDNICFYLSTKVDFKNLKKSLLSILEATLEAFPDLNEFEIYDKAIEQALISLPTHVQRPILKVRNKLKERHRINPKIPLLDYHQFMDLVEKHMSNHDEKSGKNILTKDVSELDNEQDFLYN